MQLKTMIICGLLAAVPLAGAFRARANQVELSAILQDAGIPDQDTAAIQACLDEAARQGLPQASIRLRLQEGLVKRVPPDQLLAALRQHIAALDQARQLQKECVGGQGISPHSTEGLDLLARALESGMPPEALVPALADSQGRISQRTRSMIEAGELLHLAGVDDEGVKLFIGDCRERDLPRMATMRAARFWIQEHRAGRPAAEIHQRLWGATTNRERRHEQGQRGGRGRGAASRPSPSGP